MAASSSEIPSCAWRRRLDNPHRQKLKEFTVGVGETLGLLPLAWRMFKYIRAERKAGREPIMDPFISSKPAAINGVPCGGIGCGSIGRGWRGDFNRWGLKTGFVTSRTVDADQFSVCVKRGGVTSSTVLSPLRPTGGHLSGWDWRFRGENSEYAAIFPKAWTTYDGVPDPNIRMTCKQVSPFIPHNYRESSFPACVFEWTVENTGAEEAQVSIMFTFQNGTGDSNDKLGGHFNRSFRNGSAVGVSLHHTMRRNAYFRDGSKVKRLKNQFHEDALTIAIAAEESPDVKVTYHSHFYTTGDGRHLWNQFVRDGCLDNQGDHLTPSSYKQAIGAAVCATVTLRPGEKSTVKFSLTWDMPIARFTLGTAWYRRYTKYLGKDGDGSAAQFLSGYSLSSYKEWEAEIDNWQEPVLSDSTVPDWYKATLFNELYYLVEGGTLWTEGTDPIPCDFDYPWKPLAAAHYKKTSLLSKRSSSDITNVMLDLMELQTPASYQGGLMLKDYTTGADVRILAMDDLYVNTVYQTARGTLVRRLDSGKINVGGLYNVPLFDHTGTAARLQQSEVLRQSFFRAQFASFVSQVGTSSRRASSLASEEEANRHARATSFGVESDLLPNDIQQIEVELNVDVGHLKDRFAPMTNPSGIPGDESIGRFAYLEGLEYLMYNTYDVHFYASFALIMLFPKLELSLQRDIAQATMDELREPRRYLGDGNERSFRKVKFAVPHDIGNPGEDPWRRMNSYNIHNVSSWKDLNSKFVLQIYRDYIATEDEAFLRDTWPAVRSCVDYAFQFDIDDDGLLEHGGWPDHTYDAWPCRGASAYCGGLWMACLDAASCISDKMGELELSAHWRNICEKAKVSYEKKLWNGAYYNYDDSSSKHHDSIHSDQLAGLWYARACNLSSFIPQDNAIKALQTIYKFNVKGINDGRLGAMNGVRPSGRVDNTCLQSREVWTGVTYGLAATMIQEGLVSEGFSTAEGLFHACWEDYGYWFQSPEAVDVKGRYRSLSYMRALAVWAMQWALDAKKQKKPSAGRTSSISTVKE